jgi:hypothetical protein
VVSSIGLSSTALLAALVAVHSLPDWSWLIGGLLALHAISSILVVRARLERRAGTKTQFLTRCGWAFQGLLGCFAFGLAASGNHGLAAPIGFSFLVNIVELVRLRTSGALSEPLRRVGFRALSASLAHSALSVAVLW